MKRDEMGMRIGFLLIAAVGMSLAGTVDLGAKDSCLECHLLLEGTLSQPAALFEVDVHGQHGLSCADCHGGDPSEDDMLLSMSPERGFVGTPTKQQTPKFCARCHSNAVTMQRFDPAMRVDQYEQFVTSVHGRRLAVGDQNVATCTDCHSVHDIRSVSDPRAPVYPLNQAETCGKCHASETHMESYEVPTDQEEKYRTSVHFDALTQGDLSAPTCATCHGSHGAQPPGVDSVVNVCGTCHVLFQQAFEGSPHQPAFQMMGFASCLVCHSNHGVLRPGDEMLGVGPDSVCVHCHTPEDNGYAAAKRMSGDLTHLKSLLARSQEILDRAERAGMEVSAAKVELTGVTQTLVKARVQVHSFNPEHVALLVTEGEQGAEKTYQAGVEALRERDIRRIGLGISLIAIVLVIVGLRGKLRDIESNAADSSST